MMFAFQLLKSNAVHSSCNKTPGELSIAVFSMPCEVSMPFQVSQHNSSDFLVVLEANFTRGRWQNTAKPHFLRHF